MATSKTQYDAELKIDDNKPLVSIIVPVYNTALFLSECLDSLLVQNYRNLEIICVDDGSTDASASIIHFYEEKDPRISYYYEENAGQSVARNLGLTKATGEYVCFIDSDDKLIPNAIFQCIEVFEKHKVDIVLFNLEMFLPNGQHFPCFTGPLYENDKPILYSHKHEISLNFTNAAAGMYKRSVIVDNNISFVPGMIYEDWVFMIQLMNVQNHKIFWLNSPLYWYRRDFAQSTTSNITEKCMDLFQAYHLAAADLQKTNTGKKHSFINDEKILNESVGFLIARILNSTDTELSCKFINNILAILRQFTYSYFLHLCNYLSPERQEIAGYLYSIKSNDLTSEGVLECIKKVNYLLGLRARRQNFHSKIENYKWRFKNTIKKLMRVLLPAYRVSSSVREKVEYLTYEIGCLRAELAERKKTENETNSAEEDDDDL